MISRYLSDLAGTLRSAFGIQDAKLSRDAHGIALDTDLWFNDGRGTVGDFYNIGTASSSQHVSFGTNGSRQYMALGAGGGPYTFSASFPPGGGICLLTIQNDSGAEQTPTWGSMFEFGQAGPPVIPDGSECCVLFACNGADLLHGVHSNSPSGGGQVDAADLSITGGVDYADASTSLAADSTWYATGAQVVLDEGGYLVTMFAHGFIETSAAGRAGVITRLYNVTDSAAVANSETLIVEDDNTCNKEGCGSSVAYVEIGAPKTLRLEASRITSALYVSAPTVLSNTEGRSGISYIRISSLTITNHILTESGDNLATESGDIMRLE